MVMDFSDLKSIVKKSILDPMDHAFIYDQTSKRESKNCNTSRRIAIKPFGVNFRSTAEEMARFYFSSSKI